MIGAKHRSQHRPVEIFVDPENEKAGGIISKENNAGADPVPKCKRAALGSITNVAKLQSSKTSKGFHHSTPLLKKSESSMNAVVNKLSTKHGFFTIHHNESSICSNEVETSITEVTELAKIVSCEAYDTLDELFVKEANTEYIHVAVTNVNVEVVEERSHDEHIVEFSPMVEVDRVSPVKLEESCLSDEITLGEEQRLERLLQRNQDKVVCVLDYCRDIYEYLREAEMRNRPRLKNFTKQPRITPFMRTVLVDWLVQVADEFRLQRETVFLAIGYLDRFLSYMAILKDKLQLLGITCLFLAAKFEESKKVSIRDFFYICDNTYTIPQILRMEKGILQTLSYEIAMPTAFSFCEKILKESGASDETNSLSMYLLELTLLDVTVSMTYLPSIIACTCICIANYSLESPAWPTELIDLTEYLIGDFTECLCHVYHLYTQASSTEHQATRNKYKRIRYHEVASYDPRPLPFKDS